MEGDISNKTGSRKVSKASFQKALNVELKSSNLLQSASRAFSKF